MTSVLPPEEELALQRERTALAWDRTGVGLIVAGALYARAVEAPLGDLRHVPGIVALVAGLGLILFAYRRYERLRGQLPSETSVTHAGVVIFTGVATMALAVAALALVGWSG